MHNDLNRQLWHVKLGLLISWGLGAVFAIASFFLAIVNFQSATIPPSPLTAIASMWPAVFALPGLAIVIASAPVSLLLQALKTLAEKFDRLEKELNSASTK